MDKSEQELERRKQVWFALSDLFLDTEKSLSYEYIARVCAESGYSLHELKQILDSEVAPVCSANLLSVAGVWTGFDEQWLVTRILENTGNKRSRLGRILQSLKHQLFKRDINSHWSVVAPKIAAMRNNA